MQIEEIREKLIINHDSKKCFIFDLDGTIIFGNSMLSHDNENVLQKIIDYGHEIIFATGRSYRDFKTVMPKKFHNYKVTLFSGCVSQNTNGEIRRSVYLPRTCVEEILSICIKHKSPFIMDNITHYYHPNISGFTFGFINSQVACYRISDLDAMLATDIYKILVFDMQLYNIFTEYAEENNLTIKHHSYDNCFDLVVSGCNKYNGILPLLDSYSINDIFVFGNDFNDYEILSNFPNSIVFGSIIELLQLAKLNIRYDQYQDYNFSQVIDGILG